MCIRDRYKTARKFWASVGVVTQEIQDIIGSEIVKEAIINNSDVVMLPVSYTHLIYHQTGVYLPRGLYVYRNIREYAVQASWKVNTCLVVYI